jgi:DNA-binding IclR family transcriptional regulator
LSSLVQAVGLSKGTVHRLLAALGHQGLVMHDPDSGLYLLGPGMLRVADTATQGFGGLGLVARPFMSDLWRSTGETIAMHIRIASERICISELPSNQSMRFICGVGEAVPVHSGSAGKILLAFADPQVQQRLLHGARLDALTDTTIVDPRELELELEKVRTQGWAESHGERISGAIGVSAPVFDFSGAIVASLSVLAPAQRLEGRIDEVRTPLVQTADAISEAFGIQREAEAVSG